MRLLRWVLMQSAWCTYKEIRTHKGTDPGGHTHRVTERYGHLQAQERELRGNQPSGHLDLGQLTSRTIEKTILLFKSPACGISLGQPGQTSAPTFTNDTNLVSGELDSSPDLSVGPVFPLPFPLALSLSLSHPPSCHHLGEG